MTPPSIPVSSSSAKAQTGSRPVETGGAPGLFEQIQQGLEHQSRGQPSQANNHASSHKTTQCHGKQANQHGRDTQDPVAESTPAPAEGAPDIPAPAPSNEMQAPDVSPELSAGNEPELSLATPQTPAEPITLDGETPEADPGRSLEPVNANTTRSATPLARAIQVVQNLANNPTVEAAGTGETPDSAPTLPATANVNAKQPAIPPGLTQATQQLETNLLRWNSKQQVAVETLNPGQSATSASSISHLLSSQANQAQPMGPTTLPRFDVPGHVQQPAWQQAVAERVVMIQHQNIQQAELKLHPAELGPVSVRLESLQDGPHKQTSVQFAATHADTREALEAALPRLREMFNQQGMNLVRADIHQHFQQPGGQQDQTQTFTPQATTEPSITTENGEPGPHRAVPSDNLLDLYA